MAPSPAFSPPFTLVNSSTSSTASPSAPTPSSPTAARPDVQASRAGTAGNYIEVTFGFDYRPTKVLRVRPEIRGDFADRPVFNGGNRSQLTIGIDAILSF